MRQPLTSTWLNELFHFGNSRLPCLINDSIRFSLVVKIGDPVAQKRAHGSPASPLHYRGNRHPSNGGAHCHCLDRIVIMTYSRNDYSQ